jgi:hypothetical protein
MLVYESPSELWDDSDLQFKTSRSWSVKHPGTTVPKHSHLYRLAEYCDSQVSFVHRSAYDVFFSETDRNLMEASDALMAHNNAVEVHANVQNSLYKLCWVVPFVLHQHMDETERWERMLNDLQDRINNLVWYTARGPFPQQQCETLLDTLLSDIRHELLSYCTMISSRE